MVFVLFVCQNTKVKYLICFCSDRIIIWSTWNGNVGIQILTAHEGDG